MATLPGRGGPRAGQEAPQRGRRALAPAGSSPVERAEAGVDLLRALRPDHPIRKYDAAAHGPNLPTLERFAATYLGDGPDEWTLEGSRAVGRSARGFVRSTSPTATPWRPDRIFGPEIPAGLRDRVAGLAEADLAVLKDALDASLHPAATPSTPARPTSSRTSRPGPTTRIRPRCCGWSRTRPGSRRPGWLQTRTRPPRGAASLTATASGGARRARRPAPTRPCGSSTADGRSPRSRPPSPRPLGRRTPDARRARWSDLANFGFILLESPDPRQHVDCIHLGPVKDRLDCACPRRWVRGCERHGLCTISTVGPDDPKAPSSARPSAGWASGPVMACDRCPDYRPEA